jgi:hypothetical protein
VDHYDAIETYSRIVLDFCAIFCIVVNCNGHSTSLNLNHFLKKWLIHSFYGDFFNKNKQWDAHSYAFYGTSLGVTYEVTTLKSSFPFSLSYLTKKTKQGFFGVWVLSFKVLSMNLIIWFFPKNNFKISKFSKIFSKFSKHHFCC